MLKNIIDIQIAIQNLKAQLNKASNQFTHWEISGEDLYDPSWLIESCFLQLLAIAEVLALHEFHKMAFDEYTKIKAKKGFNESGVDPDGESYSEVLARIRCYTRALEHLFPDVKQTSVTKDLLQIIRDIHYVITDTSVFPNTPENENDVHKRIEAVLKCVFPDLKHKPVLTKQIKNFEPDTGIPSLETLVEYKYLSKKSDVSLIADQLLADTRGYISRDWTKFLYVIYETNRFRTEKDWNLFLIESGVPNNATVVVLGGEPSTKGKVVIKRKKLRRKPNKERDRLWGSGRGLRSLLL